MGNAVVSITPLAPAARFSLRLSSEAAAQLRDVAGFPLEMPINRCVISGARCCARLGPDEWLLLVPEAENGTRAQELETQLAGRHFSLVDISHRNLSLSVAGTHAREVLNGGCPLDLHDDAFPPASATRTLLAKAEVILLRPNLERTYRIECGRSFTRYVHSFLSEIAREFSRS
jgi:sarcosine oxidase subunit gamma